jgi:hypothetical protein
MKYLAAILCAVTGLSAAQDSRQTFTGVITDDTCGRDGHASMRMGSTDAECTRICILAHGSAYVLDDGENLYMLSDQNTPEAFAAQKVVVTGTLDAKTKTIQVASIKAAE